MNYLICQDWSNTSKNHAGMKYLCDYIAKKYSNEFSTIIIPQIPTCNIWEKSFYGKMKKRTIQYLYLCKQNRMLQEKANDIIGCIQKGDNVFLMEYCSPNANQYVIAKSIKQYNSNIQIFGLSHLVPSKLDILFSKRKLKKWINNIDKLLTFGHSLSDYYLRRGVPKDKIYTTFHYVDKYYMESQIRTHDVLSVIVMGNQMRNIELLRNIVKSHLDVKFIICQGVYDFSTIFKTSNVELIPFITETKLRSLMYKADISLNVMLDTIGSNVIVTSLAMGLAMVCSDVGSIRDYCDDSNTLFCKTFEDFDNAINLLKKNSILLNKLKEMAIVKAKQFDIDIFYADIKEHLL